MCPTRTYGAVAVPKGKKAIKKHGKGAKGGSFYIRGDGAWKVPKSKPKSISKKRWKAIPPHLKGKTVAKRDMSKDRKRKDTGKRSGKANKKKGKIGYKRRYSHRGDKVTGRTKKTTPTKRGGFL